MTVLKEGMVGGALNLFFIYKFLRILTTPWENTDAFKLGIIDDKGKILIKKAKLKTIEEKESYTMMHRLVWKLKRLMEKVPFGKSRLASYAAALWLIKEEKNFTGTNEELQESFLSFLETNWKNEALILKENYEGDMNKKSYGNLKNSLNEADKEALKRALAISKWKKAGGKVDKQPENIEKWWGQLSPADRKRAENLAQYKKEKKLQKEEVELDEIAPWKKGNYTVKDQDGKVLGRFKSGAKAQKYVDKIWDEGDYDSLTVEMGEEVVYSCGIELDEASKLPPHLAKFFDKKGNLKPEVAARVAKGKEKLNWIDVTPKGYGPKEEVEMDEAKMKPDMIDTLKKKYESLRGKRLSLGQNMEISKIVSGMSKDKEVLIQLVKADIPFISLNAATLLMDKHGMKAKDINMANEELEIEGVVLESTKEYAKSLEKIANDKKMSMLSKSEKQTLLKIANILAQNKRPGTEEVEIEEASSDTTDMYALMLKGMKVVPGSSKQKDIIKKINAIRKRMGMPLMKESVELEEEVLEDGTDLIVQRYKEVTPGELDEVINFGKMSDKKLKAFIAGFDSDEPMGQQAGMQFKAAKKEAKKRGIKEELSTFSKYIIEGRGKQDPDYVPGATTKDINRTGLRALADAQKKKYSSQDIKSIARKYKQNVADTVGGKTWDWEWIITLMNGMELTYDYGSNTTYIKGWKFNKRKAEVHLAKYGNDHETVRDMKGSGGKIQVAGLETAFELISEQVEIDEEAPANSVAGGNVNLDPFVKKKRKNAKVETESFGGRKVFVVSPDRFFESRLGKSRYARYEKYVGNDKLGEAIRQYGRANPKESIILKNSGNGAMLYLKYGRK